MCSLLAIATVIAVTVNVSRAPDATEPVDLADVEELDPPTGFEQLLIDGLEINRVPDDLLPGLQDVEDDKPDVYQNGCHLGYDDVELPDGCWVGDSEADTTMMLVGDSHGAQWSPRSRRSPQSRAGDY
ncbi:hypothetical protein GCM10029992_05850 [Glycomyces albus]